MCVLLVSQRASCHCIVCCILMVQIIDPPYSYIQSRFQCAAAGSCAFWICAAVCNCSVAAQLLTSPVLQKHACMRNRGLYTEVTYAHTRTHSHAHTRTHTHAATQPQKHIHAHTMADTHTHACTHTPPLQAWRTLSSSSSWLF